MLYIPCKCTQRPIVNYNENGRVDLTVFAEHEGGTLYRLEWRGVNFGKIEDFILAKIIENRFGFILPQFFDQMAVSFPFTVNEAPPAENRIQLAVETDNSLRTFNGHLARRR